MEGKILRHLKDFSSFLHSIIDAIKAKNSEDLKKIDPGLLSEVEIAYGELASKIICLSEKFRSIAKTSKSIRQQCGFFDRIRDRNASAIEEETEESRFGVPEKPLEKRKHFRVMMDVSNFLPEEVDVKIIEKYLVIHVKHDTLIDDHGTIFREFTRKFEIPKDVDIETFRALVDCYGVLTVEASLQPMNVKRKSLICLLDTCGQASLQPNEDLGPEFQEMAQRQIKDGMYMREFARNLAKQRPSAYIPLEEVV